MRIVLIAYKITTLIGHLTACLNSQLEFFTAFEERGRESKREMDVEERGKRGSERV